MVEARDTHDTDDVDSAQAPVPPPGAIPDPPPAAQIEEFFRRYWQGLVHSLQREGANLWEAQDAVAEAIREALRRWSELTHPVAWVRTAARSHWLKQRRSAGHGDVEVLVADISELGAGRADPELVAYELREWFAGVLARLPPARREALELSAQGLTPAEIAQLVGKTPEAVRTALKLGRKQAVAMWQAIPSQRGPASARTTEPEPRDPVPGRTAGPQPGGPLPGRATDSEPCDPVAGRVAGPEPGDPLPGRTTDSLPGATTGPVSGRTSEPEGDLS